MAPKNNLRFLLSLGATKMVVLQDEEDLHVYTSKPSAKARQKGTVTPEHVTEALVGK